MNILLTGAAGMLGRAVLASELDGLSVTGVDLAEGDLTDPAVAPRLLERHRPDWVIHAAAYTDVDGAESHPDDAMAVNGAATENVAAACRERRSGLTYISTDYVFAGEADGYFEADPRQPINRYGLSKARGEAAVEGLPDRWQIVRTSWLFGPGPRNFVLTVRRLLAEKPRLKVVHDQKGCPTYAPDLAAVLLYLVHQGAAGYFHVTNRGACTWHDFAVEIARACGADPRRIQPCRTEDYPTPARRPACSILLSRRLETAGYPPRPTWQDALSRYLRTLDDSLAAPS